MDTFCTFHKNLWSNLKKKWKDIEHTICNSEAMIRIIYVYVGAQQAITPIRTTDKCFTISVYLLANTVWSLKVSSQNVVNITITIKQNSAMLTLSNEKQDNGISKRQKQYSASVDNKKKTKLHKR